MLFEFASTRLQLVSAIVVPRMNFDSLVGNQAIRIYQLVSSLHELVFVRSIRRSYFFSRKSFLSIPIYPKWRTIAKAYLNIQEWTGLECWQYGTNTAKHLNPVTIIVQVEKSSTQCSVMGFTTR